MRNQKSVTSNPRLKILIIPVLSLLWLFMSLPSVFSYDNYVVSPDEVLIIVNDNYYDRDKNGKSDSLDVAEYYALQRGIPPENICHISCTNSEIGIGPFYDGPPEVIEPIKDYLETTTSGGTLLKYKIYYIVTTLGIPVKYYWDVVSPYVAYKPVDRIIEDMYMEDPYPTDEIYKLNSIYFDNYKVQDAPKRFKDVERIRRNAGKVPVYLVTRLDGPTLEIAKGLVDKAIYAENYISPFVGNAYIDSWGLSERINYSTGKGYFEVPSLAFEDVGISVTQIEDIYPDAPSWPGPYPRHTNRDYQPGDCPDALYYFGWYQHWSKPRFEWRVGGIGAEIQSYTAWTLRSRRQAAPIMLHEGVTGTVGFVDEPNMNDAFGRILIYSVIKGLDFAESAQLGRSSSADCRIGDPLYNLQRNAATRREDTFAPIIYNINVKTDQSGVCFTWQTQEPSWGYVEYGETASYGQILRDKFFIMNNDPARGYYPKHYTKRHGIDPFHTFILSQGLSPNTEYHFRIKAVDPAGNIRYSSDRTFITPQETNFFTQTWSPEIAVWGYEPVTDYNTALAGKTVRNYFNVKKFSHGGNFLRFHLQASSTKPLRIQDATVAQAQQTSFNLYVWNSSALIYEKKTYSGSYICLNLKEDTKKPITFNNGQNELYLNPGESAWSDWVQISVDVNKHYSISFYVDPVNSGLTYACYGQTKSGGRTMDAVAWTFKGNVSAESDWAALINQETVDYERLGDFTQSPNYSLGSTYGNYSIYGIDNIEVNLDRPPDLAAIGNKTVYEGQLLQFSITATDPDGDTLTYSADNLPAGATFTNQTFSWTPTYEQADTYPVIFTVSDGQLQSSETVTITVNNVNRAPVAKVLSPYSGTFQVDQPYLFHTVFADPDGCNDLSRVILIFQSNWLPSRWLIAYYLKTTNKLYLYSGLTYLGGFTPGSNNVIDTPYGKLYCAQTKVSVLGNNLIVSWSLSFKVPLIGSNSVYLLAVDNNGANTGWQLKGYINIVIR